MLGALIPTEVVDCIANARTPSKDELLRVADRIWRDIRGSVSASDRAVARDDRARSQALRVAHAALFGTG
jgi:hypothetical protein